MKEEDDDDEDVGEKNKTIGACAAWLFWPQICENIRHRGNGSPVTMYKS